MIPAIIFKTVLDIAGPVIANQVKSKLAKSPEAKNALNAEKPYQSRVAVGGSMAAFPAACYCLYAIAIYGLDPAKYIADPVLLVAVPAAAGGVYTLYGRFKSGLKPLFNKD